MIILFSWDGTKREWENTEKRNWTGLRMRGNRFKLGLTEMGLVWIGNFLQKGSCWSFEMKSHYTLHIALLNWWSHVWTKWTNAVDTNVDCLNTWSRRPHNCSSGWSWKQAICIRLHDIRHEIVLWERALVTLPLTMVLSCMQ